MGTIVKVFRFIYIAMSYILICDISSLKETQTPFFTSLLIFSCGMLCDYAGLTVSGYELKKEGINSNWQIVLGIIGIIGSIIILITGFAGLSQNLIVNKHMILETKPGFIWSLNIPLDILLKSLVGFVFLSAIEIFNNPKRVILTNNNVQRIGA